MRLITESLKVTGLPWVEHLTLHSKDRVEVDASDGKCARGTPLVSSANV